MRVAAAAQMKELDRQAIEEYGIPSLDLMERAALGVAGAVWSLVGREDEDDGVIGGADGPIAVLVGGPDREEARRVFTAVLAELYPLFQPLGVAEPGLKIRDMRSRWGVCDPGKNRITLALRLAAREPELIDYVLLHEYCHFVWPDHQPHFWALVARYMPDWKARRARLRG